MMNLDEYDVQLIISHYYILTYNLLAMIIIFTFTMITANIIDEHDQHVRTHMNIHHTNDH